MSTVPTSPNSRTLISVLIVVLVVSLVLNLFFLLADAPTQATLIDSAIRAVLPILIGLFVVLGSITFFVSLRGDKPLNTRTAIDQLINHLSDEETAYLRQRLEERETPPEAVEHLIEVFERRAAGKR